MTDRLDPVPGMRCVTIGGVADKEMRFDVVARLTAKLIITESGHRFAIADRRQRDEVRWPATIHLEGEDGWEDARHAAHILRLNRCAVHWAKRVAEYPTDPVMIRRAVAQLARVAELLEKEGAR